MNRYKKLMSNSIIFAIGNFGSKFINLFMVPLFTYVLTTSEYGSIDLITNTINLLVPVITLSIDQSVLRFVIDKSSGINKKSIISTSLFFYSVLFFVIVIPIFILLNLFNKIDNIDVYFVLSLLLLNGIQSILLQFSRGTEKIKEYAINGIIQTFVFATGNILFLVYLKMEVTGYFLALVISFLISVIYLNYVVRIWEVFNLKDISINVLKILLNYSIPLIPNGSMWWIVNNSTRYFILLFLGSSINGLFAVAIKIPTLITTATGIFTQAWQLSAFEEFESDDKSSYYSNVFQIYYQVLFIISGITMIFILPLLKNIVAPAFFDSWKIIPALVLGTIYQNLAGFLGSIYTAAKQTKGVFSSSLVGASISIALDVPFIYYFGIVGAGLGTLFGFLIMWLIRFKQSQIYVKTVIDKKNFIINNMIFCLQWISMYILIKNQLLLFIAQLVLIMFTILCNKSLFLLIYNYVKKR